MAKKTKKSPAKKPSTKKPASKKPTGKKAAAKKAATKTASATSKPTGMREINTGPGLSSADLGQRIRTDFNAGKYAINPALWHKDLVSIEGGGSNMAFHGLKAVEAKNAGWYITHKIHGASAEGPYVGSTGFALKFQMDIEDTSTGVRAVFTEVGVYTVSNGMIIREEFMYGPT